MDSPESAEQAVDSGTENPWEGCRKDISFIMGRPKKSMEGPNGPFRNDPKARPITPNAAKCQSTFIRHCFEDPRCYETKSLQKQAQLTKHSPGPIYDTRPGQVAPCTVFSPRDYGKYPRYTQQRDSQGNLLPKIFSAGGPKDPSEMRTRPKKKGMSRAHPVTDAMFPERDPNPENQTVGFLIGHTSTFGKAGDCPGGHFGIQSNFANGVQVRFAPPFDEVNAVGSVAALKATPPPMPNQSPRLRKIEQVAGHNRLKPPRLPKQPAPKIWRANRLFPYSNSYQSGSQTAR